MIDLSVDLGGVRLKNPVMPASGTFGEGMARLMALEELGAVVVKTLTREPRAGNPLPRVAEVPAGMLNAIGIPSKGVEDFMAHAVPFYRQWDVPLVASISAPSVSGFAELARQVAAVPEVAAIEANISCPNIEEDGRAFAMRPDSTARVVAALRQAVTVPLWAKLTPNTGDIAGVACAAESAGADALVVANTLLGMAIDIRSRRPKLGNVMGGLSGPAIRPIIVRMVYQCHRAVRIPVIGCGGIQSADDAVEYHLAGASAVQVGTENLRHPTVMRDVIAGLRQFCERQGLASPLELVGGVHLPENEPCFLEEVS